MLSPQPGGHPGHRLPPAQRCVGQGHGIGLGGFQECTRRGPGVRMIDLGCRHDLGQRLTGVGQSTQRSCGAAPAVRRCGGNGVGPPRISRSHTAGSAARRCRRRKRRPRTGRGPGTAPLSPAWSGDQSRVRLRCQSCAMCSHPLPGAITSAVPTRPRPCRLRPVPLRHDHTAVDATRLLSRGAKADLAPGRLFLNLVVVRHNKDPSRRLGDHRLVVGRFHRNTRRYC